MVKDDLLTTQEAAEIMGVGRKYVQRLLRDRKLKHLSLGFRCKRIRRSDLEDYINGKEVEADAADT